MDFLNNVVNNVNNSPVGSPNAPTTLGGVSGIILNVMTGAAISISIIFMVISGIKFMASRGDPRATQTASTSLLYTVVAFLVAAFAMTIRFVVLGWIGVNTPELVNGPDF